MAVLKTTTTSALALGSLLAVLAFGDAIAKPDYRVSLLKSEQTFRPNFSAQPNLDKGEVTMPVQVSIIYVIEQSLPDFLSQLASRNNMQLTLSEEVSGVLRKISLPMKLELIMPELSKSYGLEWHMQGEHLFVSSSLENINRRIELGDLDIQNLKSKLSALGLNPGANKMSFLKDKNAITLIGSRTYITKVEAIVRASQSAATDN